ncbi:MAG: hypothetical protein ABH883_06570 [Candidatus Omnitrophota bacterium]
MKIFKIFFSFALVLPFIRMDTPAQAQNTAETIPDSYRAEDIILNGTWSPDNNAKLPVLSSPDSGNVSFSKAPSETYIAASGPLSKQNGSLSYGLALDLRYFAGIPYRFLQDQLAGKTIYADVYIPDSSAGTKRRPNGLTANIKSYKNGKWATYSGKNKWIKISESGLRKVKLQIPESPVKTDDGDMFYPENTALVNFELQYPYGTKNNSSSMFYLSDFKIEGTALNADSLKWQSLENGNVVRALSVSGFPEGSDIITSMGTDLLLNYRDTDADTKKLPSFSGSLENFFLSLPVFIPKELRKQKGIISLTIRDKNTNMVHSSVRNFTACDLEGIVSLTIQLDGFSVKNSLGELIDNTGISLKIKTDSPHTSDMLPVVINPLVLRQGRLIPFDKNWTVKDIQGLGGYTERTLTDACETKKCGITSVELEESPYYMKASFRLQGGIDWTNPYYKVELVNRFTQGAVDLDDMHLEVTLNPLTDTTSVWQRPFRARIGLLDVNGNIMLGTNVSLSDGLPAVASLDVSLTNPIPKGFATREFNPKKVREIFINIEASQEIQDPRDIEIAFSDMLITPRTYGRTGPVKNIDFSIFKRDPSSWIISDIIKNTGGYFVGINYPFPVLDIPRDILEVPQIYPPVGMKESDPRHFGFSSRLTKETTVKHFSEFVSKDINVVRLFLFGHLAGVFNWDESGKDISGFDEALIQKAAGMSVESLVKFLETNEDALFIKDTETGLPLGLEKHVLDDLTAFLDILEEVEQNTDKRLYAVLCFFDFLLGDGASAEGPLHRYITGEHPEVITDVITKTKVQALFWKILKTLREDERFHKYIAIAELINEPGNATAVCTKQHFTDLLNFTGEGLYIMKETLGPRVPVSIGFRSWPADLRYWAGIADGIDILMIHYWESLESYNIDLPGMWPLDTPAETLWEDLQSAQEGRLTLMGEISPGKNLKKNLFKLEKAGYNGSLIWSYSGHDSFDAKPFMDDIAQYQEADLKFGRISASPLFKEAVDYLLRERAAYEQDQATQEVTFPDYVSGKLGDIKRAEIKNIVSGILEIAALKGMELNKENIEFLAGR